MSGIMDIEVPRNGDYYNGWEFLDRDGYPIDFTGSTLALQIRTAAGADGAPVASATFDNREDLLGRFNVKISGDDFDSIPNDMEVSRLAYDFRVTEPDGVEFVMLRGQIILVPGVTV